MSLVFLDNTFSFQIITQPTKGTATLTSDGILTYVAPDFLSGGNPFNTSLKYEYTDNGGLTTTDIVPITISNTVPVPVADTFYVGVGQTINISPPGVLANDPSPANSVSRSYISASPKLAVSSGPDAFELLDDGSFSYTHDGSSFPKVDTFDYQLFITYNFIRLINFILSTF